MRQERSYKRRRYKRYRSLRDSSKKAFYVYKGCTRKWLNQDDDARSSAGINILWPITDNKYYKEALQDAKDGYSPNNISCIIKYSLKNGATVLWMGDLESDFMENIQDDLELPKVDIFFAPHHGRDTGKVPDKLLKKMDPKIIVIGEADSKHLNYYGDYNTITQNSAGDITFDCVAKKVHIYVSDKYYSVDFLDDDGMYDFKYYIGTLNL